MPAMKDSLVAPEFLSVPEAARICGVSRNTVYSWVKKGKLDAYQTPGRTNLIRPSALVHFMHQSGMFVPGALSELAARDAKLDVADDKTRLEQGHSDAVMIVGDNPQSCALASRAFNGSSSVYEAETGYEALHLLTVRRDIRVVFIDLDVPGQPGVGTLPEIFRLHPGVGVIAAANRKGDVSSAGLPRGAILEALEKPLSPDAISAAIGRVRTRLQGTTPRAKAT